eukprot:768800-Hanusia_phi.AAC.12
MAMLMLMNRLACMRRLGGGIFGGKGETIIVCDRFGMQMLADRSSQKWGGIFHAVLESYIRRGRFAGKDQNMFATVSGDMLLVASFSDLGQVCLFNPQICHLVSPPTSYLDRWMYLKEYLN